MEKKLQDVFDKCPTCDAEYVTSCRCPRSDRICKNGHHWHMCVKHQRIVIGQSDHGKDIMQCTCGIDNKVSLDGKLTITQQENVSALKIWDSKQEAIIDFRSNGDVFHKDKLISNDENFTSIIKSVLIDLIKEKSIYNFNQYQVLAHTTALYLNNIKKEHPNLPEKVLTMMALSYAGLGLGESGEVQNKLKKIIRDTNGELSDAFKDDIKKELGDILWYVAEMCSILKIDMDDVAKGNIQKLFKRKDEGKLQGSGDNR